jgi:hypothetical protein
LCVWGQVSLFVWGWAGRGDLVISLGITTKPQKPQRYGSKRFDLIVIHCCCFYLVCFVPGSISFQFSTHPAVLLLKFREFEPVRSQVIKIKLLRISSVNKESIKFDRPNFSRETAGLGRMLYSLH